MLCSLLLVSLFGGCGHTDSGSSAEGGSTEDVVSATPSDELLTICVEEFYTDAVQSLIDAWEWQNDGVTAEMIVIPSDSAEAEVMLTQLRTEIMAGGGPDVYLLQCPNPGWEEGHEVLFNDPEKMMYSDLFLPLDDYMARAQYLHTEDLNGTILDAGKTEEGQLILPLEYSYFASAYDTAELTGLKETPASWADLMECSDPAVMQELASHMQFWFYDSFGSLVDYENQMPLLTADDLYAQVREAISYNDAGWAVTNTGSAALDSGSAKDLISSLKLDKENAHTIFAFPNSEGGVTANITMYAAINRNTSQAENAFSLLDLLFSDEVMNGKGFVGDDGFCRGNLVKAAFDIDIPINDTLFAKEISGLSEEDIAAFQTIDGQINAVRFHSDLDSELWDLYSECAQTGDEAEQKQIASQTYNTLWMKLSE
jgi:hypothetical protein